MITVEQILDQKEIVKNIVDKKYNKYLGYLEKKHYNKIPKEYVIEHKKIFDERDGLIESYKGYYESIMGNNLMFDIKRNEGKYNDYDAGKYIVIELGYKELYRKEDIIEEERIKTISNRMFDEEKERLIHTKPINITSFNLEAYLEGYIDYNQLLKQTYMVVKDI